MDYIEACIFSAIVNNDCKMNKLRNKDHGSRYTLADNYVIGECAKQKVKISEGRRAILARDIVWYAMRH